MASSVVSSSNNNPKINKRSDAFKRRTLTKEDIDKHTTETEYSNLWNNREVSKEGYKFLTPKEIKSLLQKHLPCQSVCCSAKQDLEDLGILEEYREHMRRVRDQTK